MNKVEVFFDYICPYSMRGYEYLTELAPLFPQIEIVWRPCESHPRPDTHGPHSDLCIQGMFCALEQGVDLWAYHNLMFEAAQKSPIDIEDIDTLAASVRELINPDYFRSSLQRGEYIERLNEANRYAFEQSGVWAVPSYRMNGKKLDSVKDIGVTKEQLKAFLLNHE